jgi:hypothetical protein
LTWITAVSGAESRYNPELSDFSTKAEVGVVGRMSEL